MSSVKGLSALMTEVGATRVFVGDTDSYPMTITGFGYFPKSDSLKIGVVGDGSKTLEVSKDIVESINLYPSGDGFEVVTNNEKLIFMQ